MPMDEKNKYVKEFIDAAISKLDDIAIHISDEQRQSVYQMYLNSDKPLDDIKREVTALAQQTIEAQINQQYQNTAIQNQT